MLWRTTNSNLVILSLLTFNAVARAILHAWLNGHRCSSYRAHTVLYLRRELSQRLLREGVPGPPVSPSRFVRLLEEVHALHTRLAASHRQEATLCGQGVETARYTEEQVRRSRGITQMDGKWRRCEIFVERVNWNAGSFTEL